jgi:hypothetical protein
MEDWNTGRLEDWNNGIMENWRVWDLWSILLKILVQTIFISIPPLTLPIIPIFHLTEYVSIKQGFKLKLKNND